MKINELEIEEGDERLEFLFTHQLKEDFKYSHSWTEGDVLAWDNLWTMHNARADYDTTEVRLMWRCQTMADRILLQR